MMLVGGMAVVKFTQYTHAAWRHDRAIPAGQLQEHDMTPIDSENKGRAPAEQLKSDGKDQQHITCMTASN